MSLPNPFTAFHLYSYSSIAESSDPELDSPLSEMPSFLHQITLWGGLLATSVQHMFETGIAHTYSQVISIKLDTTASKSVSGLSTYEDNPRRLISIENRYLLQHTLHDLEDVGHLTVKVHKATGLAAADFGAKSDPFCVLELGNTKVQTQTVNKTLSPTWQEEFTFDVKDINSVLEITVFDEDWDKVDFLGKVLIPLLRIQNGEQRWYCLKDKNLLIRAKGNNPMILLEMNIVWNPIRGCIRSLHPKEKYVEEEEKFKIPIFVKNVLRLKGIIMDIIQWGKSIQEYCVRSNPLENLAVLLAYVTICYYFKPYMIPAVLLIIFFRYYIVLHVGGKHIAPNYEEEFVDDHEEDDDKEKEEKKSLKKRLHEIQDVTQTVQNAMGQIASLGEQVKNTFNFTVPFISYIAMGFTFTAMIMLYFIPLRYVVMFLGILKMARKMFRPKVIPNNEIIDLLSRVPDDIEVLQYREFRPDPPEDTEKKKDHKKK